MTGAGLGAVLGIAIPLTLGLGKLLCTQPRVLLHAVCGIQHKCAQRKDRYKDAPRAVSSFGGCWECQGSMLGVGMLTLRPQKLHLQQAKHVFCAFVALSIDQEA